MMPLRTIIVAGALIMAATPALAEEAHHPVEGASAPPPAASPTTESQSNMMGTDMTAMMNMMNGGAMPMTKSLKQMMAPEHILGRIAFLKTELKITPVQQKLWDAFADALRANSRSMTDMMSTMQSEMMAQPGGKHTLLQRAEAHEGMIASRLEGLRQMNAALKPLYANLGVNQKLIADELLMQGPMGAM
jgi:hypothetical protein